jgi:hypothetical protein
MSRDRTFGFAWLVAFGLSTLAVRAQDTAVPPVPPEPTAGLQQLVQQLGDPSSIVRDAATAELIRQGPAAKDLLTEALTDRDLEIRTRAGLILQRLQQESPGEDPANPPGEPEPTADQRELVRQLGHRSFLVREAATKKLSALGAAGKTVLVEGLDDPDLEIRRRVRWILDRVREQEFNARLEAFLADVDGKQQLDLPGWKRFREIVGPGRAAREMFAAMTRSEGALLFAYEKQSPILPDLYADRAAWVQAHVSRRGQLITSEVLATLLLIGSDEKVKNHSQNLLKIYQVLNYSETRTLIEGGNHPLIVMALLKRWVTAASASGSSYGLMMALKYELKEQAFGQAKRLIEKKTPSSSSLHYAIITVGKFGDKDDVPLLTPLLDNKTVCHRWSNSQLKKNGTINVEVRDAALVVILGLLGKDPKQYGFNLLREHPETLYYVYTFGFVEDSEREAAHAKWAKESPAAAE